MSTSNVLQQLEIASRLRSAFPSSLRSDIDAALAIVPIALHPPHRDIGPIRVDDEYLHIPSRIYSPEPNVRDISRLVGVPSTILACLYTRHHDGHVRERHLRGLIRSSAPWVPPFVLQLAGEYVIEIIQVIANNLDSTPKDAYRSFAAANPAFIGITRQRILSYWNCYYRREFQRLEDYPAVQVLGALGLWSRK